MKGSSIPRTSSGVREREVGARGTLADQPIVRWLISALDARIDATARLYASTGEFRLHVRHGVLVGLESPDDPGGDRRWTDNALLRATAIFALGPETRIEIGPPEELEVAHRLTVPPLELITRGLRALAGGVEPLVLLHPFGSQRLAVREGAPIGELGLLAFEMQVVDALRRRPRSCDDLLGERVVHVRALSATLFVLHELRFLEGADGPPVVARAMSAAPAPRREPGRPKEAVVAVMPTANELEARLRAMASETSFEMLGVSVSASLEEIQSALAKQLFQYHPDRLPPAQNRLATLICARLTGAARQLSHPETRTRMLEELASEHETFRRGPQRPEEILREAERHARARDFREAEAILLRALEHHHGEPNMTALLAWCQAEAMEMAPCGPGQRTNRYNHQLRILRTVVKDHPRNVRARFYFAELLKRSGRVDAAMRQFQIVVDLQPQNVGAARELRLHAMRARKARQPGLFERFLKKR